MVTFFFSMGSEEKRPLSCHDKVYWCSFEFMWAHNETLSKMEMLCPRKNILYPDRGDRERIGRLQG